jgi:hypothetical protein
MLYRKCLAGTREKRPETYICLGPRFEPAVPRILNTNANRVAVLLILYLVLSYADV